MANNTVTILNAIRETATDAYQNTVPLATMENFKEVGPIVLNAPETIKNEFFNALINKVGLQLYNSKQFGNPLIDLKKGTMEYGQTIEDIFVEMARPHEYIRGTREGDPIPDQFAINKAITKTAFYYTILDRQYFTTIHENDLKRAFWSGSGLGRLISTVMLSLKNGENYDDYRMTIGLIARQVEESSKNGTWKGEVPLLTLYNNTVPEGEQLTTENCLESKDFLRFMSNQFKKWSNRLESPRKDLNNAGVINWIPASQQRIMMLADIQSDIDTNLMAWAYNSDRLEIGAIDKIDAWYSVGASTEDETDIIVKPDDITVKGEFGLGGEKPLVGVIYESDMLKIYQKTRQMSQAYNARGLYYNVFSTFEDLYACSPFSNFVAFTLA